MIARRIIRCSSCQSYKRLFVTTQMASDQDENTIALDDFALRQWKEDYSSGTSLKEVDTTSFMSRVNKYYQERKGMQDKFQDKPVLVDGYAPFCKHIFMPNFIPSLRLPVMPLSEENKHLLCSRYEARTPKELPVLVRYFPKSAVDPPKATFLDLILYSREQIEKERAATNEKPLPTTSKSKWRLISIKAQDVPYETPMTPITIFRNAIISEGGSGVPIDREAYLASVKYWDTHATII